MKKASYLCLLTMMIFIFLLSGCSYFNISINDPSLEQFSVAQEIQSTLPVNLVPEPPAYYEIVYTDMMPAEAEKLLQGYIDEGKLTVTSDVNLTLNGKGEVIIDWYYVAATAFYGIEDDITLDELKGLWQGTIPRDSSWTGLYIQETDLPLFEMQWGKTKGSYVHIVDPESMLSAAWGDPQAVFIFPFEQVGPRWKILKFDNVSIFSRPLDAESYPLNFVYAFDNNAVDSSNMVDFPLTNFDRNKMTTVLMTGVTALARGTGAKMDTEGVTYPASTIRDILMDADITHISNEVSFAKDCPLANADTYSVMFCSRPEYFDLFTYIDADVVELSGNHLKDWSQASFDYSLTLYEDAGIAYYSGGRNQEDSRKPYLVELNGNKLAFVGCNPAGPENVWATDELSGVANCDDGWLVTEVQNLVRDGYLPIVTMQHFETYAMEPNIGQKTDFLNLSAKGAVIVSGSQAHLPQGMTFIGDHFIHFGLGNLFFDQMDVPVVGTRREFMDRHIFYDGRYIQTELYTAMLEDYARPRIMTDEERSEFLSDIFTASHWMTVEE